MTERGLGAIPSPPDARDFPVAALYAARGLAPAAVFPAEYVVPGELPPVLDQDGTPQCVAYSSASLKLYEDRIDQHRWFPFDKPLFFSQIGGTSKGAYVRAAFSRLLHYGYPLDGGVEADLHKVAAYYSVPVTTADLQAALMAFGPLVIAIDWDAAWDNPRPDGTLPARTGSRGGHAIAVIGWRTVNGRIYFRLRNSWGASWGVNGDCYLSEDFLGNVWEAWKAVDQIVAPYTRTAMRYVAIEPSRVLDTRTAKTPLKAGTRTIQVAGQSFVGSGTGLPVAIPPEAVAVTGKIETIRPATAGWLLLTPFTSKPKASASTISWQPGGYSPAGFTCGLAADGRLSIYATASVDVDLDITGYFLPDDSAAVAAPKGGSMLTGIRSALGGLIAFLHNLWAIGPIHKASAEALWPAVQAALVGLVFLAWQFVTGYGWTIPGNVTDVNAWLAEALNAAALAWVLLVPAFKERVWPVLVRYILTIFDFAAMGVVAGGSTAHGYWRGATLWVRV
jgi:hypothetical protein